MGASDLTSRPSDMPPLFDDRLNPFPLYDKEVQANKAVR